MVVAPVLAGIGCKLALLAGSAEALAEIAVECGVALQISAQPSDEAACADMVAAIGRFNILVVASGMNKVTLV